MNPIDGIIEFNKQRELNDFNAIAEYKMLEEELQEFLTAYAENDEYEMVDALCDIIVFAVGGIRKLGYAPEAALQETVKEIMSRKGSLDEVSGKWQKDPSQDPATLYKAQYSNARNP